DMPPQGDAEQLLLEAIELVAETRAMPMSSTIKVSKDELLDLLEGARDSLPADLYTARELLQQRDDFIVQARRERQEIIDQGSTQVSRMVERQEVVKAAESRAQQIVDDARAEALDMRRQVEDYCDQKLASFEVVLDKTVRTVQQGREKLLGTGPAGPPPAP
ncbi:MAG: vacuolar-type H+-ATPase subunit H, partial [Acidimicrobiales bacterium]